MNKKKTKHTSKNKNQHSRSGKKMLNQCKRANSNHATEPASIFNYAHELYKHGDSSTASKIYQKGLKRRPFDNTALINLSLIMIALHKFSQAIIYLTRAIVHKPDQLMAYVYRSVAYVGIGKKAEAYEDFQYVHANYPDKIHHFRMLDRTRFPQIDFDQAMEYCRQVETVALLRPKVFYPTVDCPVDEICLLKEFCQQNEACPQNDTAILRDIIIRQKLGHPRDYAGEEMTMGNEKVPVNVLAEEFKEIVGPGEGSGNHVTPRSKPGVLHRNGNFRNLVQYLVNFKNRLIVLFNSLFLCLILPFNEVLLE